MSKLQIIGSKLRRTFDILVDNSEALNESPSFRLQIIKNIWKSKY